MFKQTIAYLASEIPSLSATFIYKEILALQERGLQVITMSVHYPIVPAKEAELKKILENTHFLYQQKFTSVIVSNLKVFFRHPSRYLITLFLLLSDMWQIGLINPEALKLLYHFFQASQVAKILEEHQCQHLHIHFAHVPTQIGMYASSLSKIPFTFTSHANDLFERGLLLKEKVNRSKAAITISEYNRKFMVSQGLDPRKIKLVRCGIDTKKYEFIDHQKHTNKQPVIISLGRLVEKKGMDTLILSLKNLAEGRKDFSGEIAGDGLLINELKSLVSQHNLTSKINFKGAIAHDDVFSWMRQADIFVLACKEDRNGDQDGIPVVLMEAMAVGIPVVSTEISGIPELIQDGVSGFLAKPNDPESLTEAIERVLNGSKPIAQITKAARQRIVDEFDQDKNIDRLLDIFNQIS